MTLVQRYQLLNGEGRQGRQGRQRKIYERNLVSEPKEPELLHEFTLVGSGFEAHCRLHARR